MRVLFEAFEKILYIGAYPDLPIVVRQRIIYFNAILVSLPLVYSAFIIYDIDGYLKPFSEWYLDQWSFFIFTAVCGLCFYLNKKRRSGLGKVIFIISWPIILHIAPIIVQQTPSDYYYAFPMGLIFHSLMIQCIFSRWNTPWLFGFFLLINFLLSFNFLDILAAYDNDSGGAFEPLITNPFYGLIMMLYWLLFNMVVYYIFGSIDRRLVALNSTRELTEKQRADLESTLSQLEASNAKLIESEKLASLGVFTAGIAHELNNPLNFISSGAQVLNNLLKDIQDKTKDIDLKHEMEHVDKTMHAINVGVRKSSAVIQSLSNYAQPNADVYLKFNVSQCVNDAIDLFPESYLRDVEIVRTYPDDVIVEGNPGKINQVFVNLIQNAVDASPAGSKISVHGYERSPRRYSFEIIDQGVGIPKENLDKIYDPFYSSKEVGKGTGLGLFIVYGIIKEHRGSIEVQSEVNRGTTVRVTLPFFANSK